MAAAGLAALALLPLSLAAQQAPVKLGIVERIYILRMNNGMDQYLASRLTEDGSFQVVTDHTKADAILTDHLGSGFEKLLTEMYPPPKPEKPAEVKAAKNGNDSKDAAVKKDGEDSEDKQLNARQQSFNHESTFGRGRGTYFLVDPHTNVVLWSVYKVNKNIQPKSLHNTAGAIARDLVKSKQEAVKQ